MKNIWDILRIMILINLSTTVAFGQNARPEKISHCDHSQKIEMDSIFVLGNVYRYKILFKSKLDTKDDTLDFYKSHILLPDFDSSSDTSLITKILKQIGYLSQTDEFTVFKDCKSLKIKYQGHRPLQEQVNYLEKNFIGHFKLKKK